MPHNTWPDSEQTQHSWSDMFTQRGVWDHCIAGRLSSLGGYCHSVRSLADKANAISLEKLAALLSALGWDVLPQPLPRSSISIWYLRFRHLKHEGEQEVNSAFLWIAQYQRLLPNNKGAAFCRDWKVKTWFRNTKCNPMRMVLVSVQAWDSQRPPGQACLCFLYSFDCPD